jgi:enamine deaminase RidA (YjgF/YER057c/UK114 family)
VSEEYGNPDSLFPSLPHGFSQVVVGTGEKMVFISGQMTPADTWIGVFALADPEFLIEIESTAVLD